MKLLFKTVVLLLLFTEYMVIAQNILLKNQVTRLVYKIFHTSY